MTISEETQALAQAAPALREDFLVFGSPQILDEDIDEVVATLRSGWIGTGPRVAAFEEAFRTYVGARRTVAVGSCTAALHLALHSLGLEPHDEVIVPAMTFGATANAVVHVGATPIFADVDRETGCVDPVDAACRITPRTRAIVPVHFAGRACDMTAIGEIAWRHGLHVVEDCAHAIETLVDGSHAGTFGEFGAFSFYVTKNVVTAEGGMLVTDDEAAAERIRALSLHGLSADAWTRYSSAKPRTYEVVEPGFKYNMTDIQAALGLHQLARVERNLERRREIWLTYNDAFADLPVLLPAPEAEGTRHARHLYTLLLDLEHLNGTRDDFREALHADRIGTGVHYGALHLHPYYSQRFGLARGDFPNAEWISDRTVSLPLSPKLTDADVHDVVAAVRRALSRLAA